jgi:hypothetical protein
METTEVDDLIKSLDFDYESDNNEDVDDDNLDKKVTDLSRSLDKRIKSLEKYYSQNGDNTIEILRTLSSMYQMSGSKLIERFFYSICTKALISPFLKVEAAKCLLDYEEVENVSGDETRDETREEQIKENNNKRKILGYKALENVCFDLSTMPAPCRVEAIFLLMKSETSRENADIYFKQFIKSDNIECEFRYSTILSLEKFGADEMKEEIYECCEKEEILEQVFSLITQWLLPSMKKTKRNCIYILSKLSYEDIKTLYKNIFPNKECPKEWFIKSAQMDFLFYTKIPVYFSNLSGQYLLKNCNLSDTERKDVEMRILNFAKDVDVEYNLRADAADILLRFGSDESKNAGRDIIMQLGCVNGLVRTVFENAQNVHTEEVEESVAETLEFLSSFQIYTVNKNDIDFDYVNSHIEKMLKEELELIYKERISLKIICKYCKCDFIKLDNENFCSKECEVLFVKNEKIRIAMQRIFMDRALYSKFNNSLLNILLKIYSYIQMQEDESIKMELYKRMLQELEEMSGTCSSGFASRLVNIISGYGNFNIRISFEDQIISNFAGRLNAAARNIASNNSIFRNDKNVLYNVVELWLLDEERNELLSSIELKMNPKKLVEKKPKIRDIVISFLSKNKKKKIEECVQYFAESVFNEMTVKSSNHTNRRCFALFFRTYISKIREELADEFKEFVTETDFDLFFRKAIMMYEGEL